jgi:hypothetical protein
VTALTIIQANVGKRPEEIVNALYRGGFAVVPLKAGPGVEGARMLTGSKPFADQWRAMVDQARVRG